MNVEIWSLFILTISLFPLVPKLIPTEDGKLLKVTVGTATLSSDARVVGPETAAAFMETFSKCLVNPESMML